MNFTPTADQADAISAADAFLTDETRRSFTIDGAAGTGKTSLLHMLAASRDAVVCAPTNKAVGVLRSKGFGKATTLDRVLNKTVYAPIYRPPTTDEIEFYAENGLLIPDEIEEENYEKIFSAEGRIVLVDESSMTNESENNRLIEGFEKVIFIGDAFQLPPVEGVSWFQTIDPDVRLSEIVRTAAQSEITQAANLIRRKSPEWKKADWQKEVKIVHRNDFDAVEEAIKLADVTLAHKNRTCDTSNFDIRALRGLTDPHDPYRPMAGDHLLAWETIKGSSVLKSETYPVRKSTPFDGGYLVAFSSLKPEIHPVCKANLKSQKTEITVKGLRKFSFAHCVTGHKSQGSEWDRVVVLEHDISRAFDNYWNWLYTAVSRAKQHLTIVV